MVFEYFAKMENKRQRWFPLSFSRSGKTCFGNNASVPSTARWIVHSLCNPQVRSERQKNRSARVWNRANVALVAAVNRLSGGATTIFARLVDPNASWKSRKHLPVRKNTRLDVSNLEEYLKKKNSMVRLKQFLFYPSDTRNFNNQVHQLAIFFSLSESSNIILKKFLSFQKSLPVPTNSLWQRDYMRKTCSISHSRTE